MSIYTQEHTVHNKDSKAETGQGADSDENFALCLNRFTQIYSELDHHLHGCRNPGQRHLEKKQS